MYKVETAVVTVTCMYKVDTAVVTVTCVYKVDHSSGDGYMCVQSDTAVVTVHVSTQLRQQW